MGLLNIKDCHVVTRDDLVTVSGIDKIKGGRVYVKIKEIEFNEWQDGIPLKYAIPSLSKREFNFLMRGTTNE